MAQVGAGYVLRVNVLEQCQYRCPYCLPGAVSPYTPNARRLSPQQYERLGRVFLAFGIRKVRFTGGEPLLREDLPEIVSAFREAMPGAELAVTTNGEHLAARLEALIAAGLCRATVHIDSLNPARYRALMGEGDLAAILQTVLHARTVLEDVKVNAVIQRGANDDEIPAFLEWSRRTGVQVRFIELMNTGSAVLYTRKAFCSGAEIVERAGAQGEVRSLPRKSPSDPAALFSVGGVVFGVIASDTQPFCADCNRLRLTPRGQLRGCLYQPGGIELGQAMRDGASDDALAQLVRLGISNKRSHHPDVAADRAPFSMSEAGG